MAEKSQKAECGKENFNKNNNNNNKNKEKTIQQQKQTLSADLNETIS